MKTQIKYYKPKTLFIGLMIFALSFLAFGIGIFNNGYNCVGLSDKTNLMIIIFSIIGWFIGEGIILDAASYKEEIKDEHI